MMAPMKLTGEQGHITVLLSSQYSDIYKPFHCVSCGNVVFSYNEDEVRSILPSGHPQLNRSGKSFMCNGVMKLRNRTSAYDTLYQIIDTAMRLDNMADLRTAIAYIAKSAELETTFHCKMIYFVS